MATKAQLAASRRNAKLARAALKRKIANGEPLGKKKFEVIALDAVPLPPKVVKRRATTKDAPPPIESLAQLIVAVWINVHKANR